MSFCRVRKEWLVGGVALAAIVALGGCTNTEPLPEAPLVPGPVPMVTQQEYRIHPGDVLDIRLLLNPELNEEVPVGPDGYISTTIVHRQMAAGLTVPQLDSALNHDYGHQLQHPSVSIVVKSFAPDRVYVAGQVTRPGVVVTEGQPPTLAQAIADAGGPLLGADESDIFIIRRGTGNKPILLKVRWKDITHARNPDADVRLADYDVVYVPKLGVEEVYKWYHEYIEQFAHPSFGFSYLVAPGSSSGVVTLPSAPGTVVTTAPPVPTSGTP